LKKLSFFGVSFNNAFILTAYTSKAKAISPVARSSNQ